MPLQAIFLFLIPGTTSGAYFIYPAGLEILAFPCNQFAAEEPGSNEQILEFACTRYKAEYPVFAKVIRNTAAWLFFSVAKIGFIFIRF